jgi:hypothetical protein
MKRFTILLLPCVFAVGCAGNPPLPGGVTVVPEPLDFRSVFVGDTLDKTAAVTNTRGRPVVVQASSLGPGMTFTAGATPALPHLLPHAASLAFAFRFTPPDVGDFSGAWHLTVGGATHVVRLLGRGVLAWWDETMYICGGADPNTGLDFGDVLVLTTSRYQEISLRYTGGAVRFNALPASSNPAFAVIRPTANDLPIDLMPPGRSMQKIRVTFTPPSVGRHTGVLTWTDSTGKTALKVQLSGVGVPPPGTEGE